jgi:hypothetical protein
MNTQELIRLGVPPGEATRRGIDFISRYILKGLDRSWACFDKTDREIEVYVSCF